MEIPANTKFLNIDMLDIGHHHDNKTVLVPYSGDGNITKIIFNEITTPCPGMLPGQYKISIKAIGEDGVVIGIGSKERSIPEN